MSEIFLYGSLRHVDVPLYCLVKVRGLEIFTTAAGIF